MSNKLPQYLIGGGLASAAGYYLLSSSSTSVPSKTTGTKSIEDRFTAGGGTPSHQPGVTTERGSRNTESKQQNQGADKKPFSEGGKREDVGTFSKGHYQQEIEKPKK